MFSYDAASVFAFWGGMLFLNRMGAAVPSNGIFYEIDLVFPLFFAGCSILFDNRSACVPVILFACFWMAVFKNLTAILGLSTYYMDIYRIIFLITAIALDRVYRNRLFSFITQKSKTENPV